MPSGFLIVFSETGERVSLDEFQDWYNNEHVPLRMNYLPSFLTGARFSAADSLKPSWAALYDIDNTSTFQHESYTRLRETRSPREANLVGRLELLDRRLCELVYDSGESTLTSSLASQNPTKFIVTHGVNMRAGKNFEGWVATTVLLSKELRGWVRTRGYKYLETLKTGSAVSGKGPEEQIVPEYLVVHELLDRSDAESSGFARIIGASDEGEILELRRWDLYRAYPGIAQGNI